MWPLVHAVHAVPAVAAGHAVPSQPSCPDHLQQPVCSLSNLCTPVLQLALCSSSRSYHLDMPPVYRIQAYLLRQVMRVV